MCGFAGFFSKSKSVNNDLIRSMVGKLNHRGPDSDGVWINELNNFGFGHTRLSILDTSNAGSQPMNSDNSKFVICFNGEIYNHIILRKNLEKDFPNINFESGTDTETILCCFDKWGIQKTLKSLTGMFSLALYDKKDNKLYLTRDRFGEKPLYYGWQNDNLFFASELKSIVTNPYFKKEINQNALDQYFNLSYIPNPLSIYRDIFKLVPGTFVEINFEKDNRDFNIKEFWNLHDEINKSQSHQFIGTDNEAISLLEEKLTSSILSQQISDVPIGAFLSGGIDSSLVVSIMQKINCKPVNTFTIGFNESIYNEAKYAKEISSYLGTHHTDLYIGQNEIIDVIPKLSNMYDEPFADSSQIPTFLVSQLAKRNVTVSLSGDGGDELFGGYNRYTNASKFNNNNYFLKNISKILLSLNPSQLNNLYNTFKLILPKHLKSSNPINHFTKIANIIDSKSNWEIYSKLIKTGDSQKILNKVNNNSLINLKYYFDSLHPSFSFPQRMMYVDTLTYLSDDILTKVDRASMSVSLESRVPFLDHRIVSFAWSLPMNMKIRNGEGKWILKQLLNKYIPKNLIERPKMGFGLPLDIWLRTCLKNWAQSLLSEEEIKKSGILNYENVIKLWNDHQGGVKNSQFEIWNILMFRIWENKWMS
jgi:asparagine synthase (glutamine-hydrolysing)